MFWRVQSAWSGGIHQGFAGREEHLAQRDVERLLGTWIVKNLAKISSHYGQMGRRQSFALYANMVAQAIVRRLDMGDVWGAYDSFHAFLDRHKDEFDFPVWMVMGTVVVEAPPGKGPQTRKRFITQEDFPKEMPPDVMVMEGSHSPALGAAARRWKVSWEDMRGKRHASIFMREDEALNHLALLLDVQMEKLHTHASIEAAARMDPDRMMYADEAPQLVFQVRQLLAAGRVLDAYELWRAFEERYEDAFPQFGLRQAIGTVLLEVE